MFERSKHFCLSLKAVSGSYHGQTLVNYGLRHPLSAGPGRLPDGLLRSLGAALGRGHVR